jgi:hypothetical protein
MKLTTRVVAVCGLMGVAVAGVPAPASAGGPRPSGPAPSLEGRATLYELTENMKLIQRPGKRRDQSLGRRIATAAITGVASPGSPLCPIPEFQSGPLGCAVNVQGKDSISLLTGLGTLEGDFATVIQGDNPVDGPEAVVLRGEFRGQMDFSPAILEQVPYGTVTGRVRADRGRRSDFTGVFRLPFAGNVKVEVAPGVTMTLAQIFCPGTPVNPFAEMYGGFDLKYLDTAPDPETGEQVPNGACLNIEPHELSLGAPLVRFDITF